jgi:KDO2-lipid IV(A) lauroyltransferase
MMPQAMKRYDRIDSAVIHKRRSRRALRRWLKLFWRSRAIKLLAYYASFPIVLWLRNSALSNLLWTCAGFGYLAPCVLRGRFQTAVDNLRSAFPVERKEHEIQRLAIRCSASSTQSIVEVIRFRGLFERPGALSQISRSAEGLDGFLLQIKGFHERTGGCIFVTPHLGCYGLLPYLFSIVNVPIVIPIGDAGNEYIEGRWCPLNTERCANSEIFIPRKNSLNLMRAALRAGRSVGLMPDQRTLRGVPAIFFGVSTPTTPVPALLAIGCQRPIVIGACYRRSGLYAYTLVLGEPIWPGANRDKRTEVLRLTQTVNRQMESLIRRHPEQYLWLHNRWKPKRVKGKIGSQEDACVEQRCD